MYRTLLMIFILPSLCFAQLIDEYVMPFGGYSSHPCTTSIFFSDSCLEVMHDELGINQFMMGGFTGFQAGRFAEEGIYVYPWGTAPTRPQQRYAHSSYYICDAEDDYSDFKFETRSGTVQDSFLVYGGNDFMLNGLYFRQENYQWMMSTDQQIRYYPYLKMMIERDTLQTHSSTVVGVFYAINIEDNSADSTRFADTLIVANFPSDHDTLLSLTNDWESSISYSDNFYYVLNDDNSTDTPKMEFRFKAAGNCTVFIDYFKVHCQYGDRLFGGDPEVARNIKEYVGRKADFDGKVLGWYLKDEPFPGNYRPYGYIDSLIQVAMSESSWTEPVRGAALFYQHMGGQYWKGLKDFTRLGHPYRIWIDPYCFYGGQDGSRTTKYTGYFVQGPPYVWGLQYELNNTLVRQIDSVISAIANIGVEDSSWIFTPQYFAGRDSTYPGDTTWIWRFPTRSEMICETFIGLCYKPMGIMFWKYDQNWNSTNNSGSRGLVNDDGSHHYMYDVVKNDINPYIKAIDSTYMSLTWDTAYAVHHGTPSFNPPSGAWLDSITAKSNDTLPNPDLNWFHVGQFTEGSDKYVMIVNRACSDTLGNAAPSITATIKFDAEELDLGNYVEIIDLATGTDSADWVGTPDTTFCSASSNIITYCAEFGPGKGRLFKLVEVDDNFTNPVTDSVWLCNNIILLEDLVVHDTGTLIIDSCANIYVHPESDVTIINYGEIIANGTASDSIYFGPWIEESDTAFAGDWVGIAMEGDTASTSVNEFNYCTIRYAEIGIEMRGNIETSVSHCKILNNETSGIYNYEGSLILTHSQLSENGVYGLDCVSAVDSVANTKFHLNGSYGIRINGTNTSNDESYLIADTITYTSGENNTQYGIYVKNNDYITVDLCVVNYHNQGGLKLENSDAEVLRSTFESIDNYGLYTLNGGTPVVRYCTFDTLDIGAKAVLPSIPDLGDTSTTDGDNSFLCCRDYFVHFSGLQGGVQFDSLFAQMNWWGSSSPSTRKFYHSPPNIVIVYSPYRTSAPKLSSDNPLPLEFMLNQNYPNPFNSNTFISFSLDKPEKTSITIYNILGQKVTKLLDEYMDAGHHSIIWDGKNSSGSHVASGVYFYTKRSGDRFDSKKMLLLR